MPLFPRAGRVTGEFFLGEYAVLGGEIELFGNWVPDESPEQASKEMLQLAGYLENTEVPLLEAAAIAESDTQKRFDTETDPDGTPWIPLDPDYERAKLDAGYPDNILIREDDMRKAAVKPGAWKVNSDTLFFDPSGLPHYAGIMQAGTDQGRGNVGRAFQHREVIRGERAAGLPHEKGSQHMNLGIGRGKATPARPFIGLSDEALNEIAFEFDLWFDQGVEEIFIHPHTFRAQRWQWKGGRRLFGPGL